MTPDNTNDPNEMTQSQKKWTQWRSRENDTINIKNKKGQICLNDDTKRSKEDEERKKEKKKTHKKNTKSPIEINK